MMKRSNKKIYWLMLIFVIPILVSRYLYHYHDYFQFKTTNHGTLVNPAVQFADLNLPAAQKLKQWQIVYLPAHCDVQSDKIMFTLHQLRIALGKDHDRVALTVAIDQRCGLKDSHDFRRVILQDTAYVRLQKLLQQNIRVEDKIYLIDPHGNLFMYYSANGNAMDILKDIKHVLEVSQIG